MTSNFWKRTGNEEVSNNWCARQIFKNIWKYYLCLKNAPYMHHTLCCLYGACMVHVWCMYGACMVHFENWGLIRVFFVWCKLFAVYYTNFSIITGRGGVTSFHCIHSFQNQAYLQNTRIFMSLIKKIYIWTQHQISAFSLIERVLRASATFINTYMVLLRKSLVKAIQLE